MNTPISQQTEPARYQPGRQDEPRRNDANDARIGIDRNLDQPQPQTPSPGLQAMNQGHDDDDARVGAGSGNSSMDRDDDLLNDDSDLQRGAHDRDSMGREGSRGGYGSGEEAATD